MQCLLSKQLLKVNVLHGFVILYTVTYIGNIALTLNNSIFAR